MGSSYERQKKYFDERKRNLKHYLARFPEDIDFRDKKVLDLGCGHGALACVAAEGGAREVLGIDINQELIDFALEQQRRNYPESLDILQFENRDILDGGLHDFDIVLSEATFEHIIGLDQYLAAVKDLLREGGRLFTGYSPLYNAPWGDHRRLKAPLRKFLPWAHLHFPQKWLLKRLSRIEQRQIASLADVGLNGLSFREHERCIRNAGMKVLFFQANNQSRPAMKAIEPLRMLPGIRELLTFSIYAILEK